MKRRYNKQMFLAERQLREAENFLRARLPKNEQRRLHLKDVENLIRESATNPLLRRAGAIAKAGRFVNRGDNAFDESVFDLMRGAKKGFSGEFKRRYVAAVFSGNGPSGMSARMSRGLAI